MEVQEVEEPKTEDKPLEEMTTEELEQAYEAQMAGESDSSEPDDETKEYVANADKDNKGPKDADNSSEDNSEAEMTVTEKAMMKTMEGLQKQFAKIGTELGNNRKEMEAIRSGANENSSQSEGDEEIDPYTDADRFIEKKLADRERKQAQSQTEAKEKEDNTKNYVQARFSNIDEMIPEMATELKNMLGDDPDAETYEQNFKANPYVVDTLTLLSIAHASKLQKEITQLKSDATKTGNGKADLIKKINGLGQNKSTINGNSNGSSNGKGQTSLTNKKIESMSLDDLEKAYELELEQ